MGVVKLYANLLGEIMKKRLPLLLVAVFALSVVLSGCNLFTMDKNAYYNQIVASITVPEDDDKKTTYYNNGKREFNDQNIFITGYKILRKL